MSKDFAGIKDVDLVPAALTGYRQWKTDLNGALRSVSYDYTWSKTETATCRELVSSGYSYRNMEEHPDQIPADNCGCGIYGWYQPDYSYQRHAGDVLGVIKVQGLTLMGTHGFRTARAEIAAVSRPKALETGDGRTIEEREIIGKGLIQSWEAQVRERFPGVEVYNTPAELIMAYPPNDVSSLIGENPPNSSFDRSALIMASLYDSYGVPFAVMRWNWVEILGQMERLKEKFPDRSAEFNAFLDKVRGFSV